MKKISVIIFSLIILSGTIQCSKKKTKAIHGFVTVDGLNVRNNVRGKIIGKLRAGEKVAIIGRTEKKHVVNKMKDYWYKIVTPKNEIGWVFAGYIMLESDKAKQKKLVQRKKGKPSDFNHFVYVVNKGSHSIGIYKIDNQGKLTLISTQKAIKKPVSIAAHPFRNFIYVLEFTRIITYKIRDNGTLEPIGTLKIGVGGKILKVHPNGKFVYATTSNPMINIGMYKVMGDGRLRGMGDVFTYKKPVDFDIEPGGRFAYFHDRKKANEILMYRIAIDGKLKTIGEQEVNKGKYSGQVVVDPAGIYLYVSSIPANAIFTYKIKPSGKLEQKNKTENAGIPGDMLFNEDGDLLYVTQLKQNKVTVYSVSKKGALLKKGEIKTGKSPEEMAIHQNGKYIYVTNKTSSEIFVYKTSGATLEKIQNIRCGVNPEAICIGRTRKQSTADKKE